MLDGHGSKQVSRKFKNPAWVGPEAGGGITGFVMGALEKTAGAHPSVQSWYGDFLNSFVLGNAQIFSHTIAFGEVLVGIGLILGAFTGIAAFFGAFMNMNFLFGRNSEHQPSSSDMSAFPDTGMESGWLVGVR